MAVFASGFLQTKSENNQLINYDYGIEIIIPTLSTVHPQRNTKFSNTNLCGYTPKFAQTMKMPQLTKSINKEIEDYNDFLGGNNNGSI